MAITIARIVGSNSHIDYVGRVIDALDVETPPSAGDYGFARFVAMQAGDTSVVGIIYDSKLINPEYASYGPRLSPRPALGSFSPDYINEQGILLGILALGTMPNDGTPRHEVPRRIVPPGQEIVTMNAADVARFHRGASGDTSLGYYAQVVAHAGEFAVPLLRAVIDDLCEDCSEADRQRLAVLSGSLQWQGTFGGMKL